MAQNKDLTSFIMPISSDLSFCPVLREMVVSGQAVGRNGNVIQISSSISTTNNLVTIRNYLMDKGAANTLEIGMRGGGSALVFTQFLKDIGASAARHIAIDPFQSSPFNSDCGLVAVERAGLATYLDFRPELSCIILPSLVKEGRSFSMIYVDGSHNFEDCFIDMYYSVKLLELNGIVLFDDSQAHQVLKVLSFVRKISDIALKKLTWLPGIRLIH